jgi:phospholipid transport system substrate-binding protein
MTSMGAGGFHCCPTSAKLRIFGRLGGPTIMALSTADRGLGSIVAGSIRAVSLAGLAWLYLVSAALPAVAIADDAVAPPTADVRDPAAIYVSALIEQAIPQLLAMPDPQRPQELRRLLDENVDLTGLARFAMGRYWRLANDGERVEFVRLFNELLVQTSNAGLADYRSEKFRVAEARPADDDEVLVRSSLGLQDGPSVQIEWRLQREMDRFKIQDVVVEGISIRIAMRDMFAAAIHEKGGTVAALLAAMRDLARPRTRDEQ